MAEEASYKIWADIAKNRLYIILKGFLNLDQFIAIADLTIEEAKKLKPGFTCINDISQMRTVAQPCTEHIKRGQVFLATHGVARVIRVVKGENAVTRMQFQRTSKDLYTADTVDSIQEADEILNQSPPQMAS